MVVVTRGGSPVVVVVRERGMLGCQAVVTVVGVGGSSNPPNPARLMLCLCASGVGNRSSPVTPTRWLMILTKVDLSSVFCSLTA